jgi:hypothetical protein
MYVDPYIGPYSEVSAFVCKECCNISIVQNQAFLSDGEDALQGGSPPVSISIKRQHVCLIWILSFIACLTMTIFGLILLTQVSNILKVSGLNQYTDEETIRIHCELFGKVIMVRVLREVCYNR